MPQVTVYIREGDLEKWKALQKKSEFIHNALNPDGKRYGAAELETNGRPVHEFVGEPKPIKPPEEWAGTMPRSKKKL